MSNWIGVCTLEKIIPGTGICALVENKQVAIFRPDLSEIVYAISNMDPFAHSNVLSRGIICEHDGQYWVASPLKKQRFNLVDGHCLEDKNVFVDAYKTRIVDRNIEVCIS